MAKLFIGQPTLIAAGRIKPLQCVNQENVTLSELEERIRNGSFERIVTFISPAFKCDNPWIQTLLEKSPTGFESGIGKGFRLGQEDELVEIDPAGSKLISYSIATASEIQVSLPPTSS